MPPAFTQLVTFLYTSDLAATSDFYANQLGLALVLDQGVCRIYRASDTGFLGFCTKVTAVGGPSGAPALQVVLTLVSDHVDAWYQELLGRGVAFEKPPTLNTQFNIYHAFLRDPNGYLLEIQQFLDPAWPRG